MSKYKANRISNVNITAGTVFSGITTFSSTSYFQVPVGYTTEKSGNEVAGSLRFNLDNRKLEFYDGASWNQVPATSTIQRGLYGPGDSIAPGYSYFSGIEYVNLASRGDALRFGDLTESASNRLSASAVSSPTRSVFAGGLVLSPGTAFTDTIDYVYIQSLGNATDFGNLSSGNNELKSHSNSTRGLFIGGNTPGGLLNTSQQINIASTGNSVAFGDLTGVSMGNGAAGSQIRGVFAIGRADPVPATDRIDYVNMLTEGNSIDFGDLPSSVSNPGAASNSTTALFHYSGKSVAKITISTTGNATDFGEIFNTNEVQRTAGISNPVRGYFTGSTNQDMIESIDFASGGNSTTWGFLTENKGRYLADGGTSDCHGGIS